MPGAGPSGGRVKDHALAIDRRAVQPGARAAGWSRAARAARRAARPARLKSRQGRKARRLPKIAAGHVPQAARFQLAAALAA